MRKGVVFLSKVCLVVGICLLISWSNPIQAQQIDPFYIDLLHKGESAYLSGDYDDAISRLKTSMFGLHSDRLLHAKALVYLSLSYYFIKEIAQSKVYLEQAFDLVGGAGFSGIDLLERPRRELSGLMAHFELGEFMPPEPEPVIISKRTINPSEEPDNNHDVDGIIADLKTRVSNNPRKISNYYDLYELYMKDNNQREARKILEKLVKYHPDEAYGFYLLGLIRYGDKKYKEAENYIREALKPRTGISLSEDLTIELKTYHMLSVYQRRDKQRALDMMAVSVHLYTEAFIRSLPLSGTDKATLREIIKEYLKR